jgi:virulence factor Mce-like protein
MRRRPSLFTGRRAVVTKPLAGLVSLAVIGAASVSLVELGDGDFSSAYVVSADFSQASAGLHPGSQVEEQGVQIGSVRSIELANGEARVTLGIGTQHRLPSDAVATVEPENLFGADQVAISVPAGTNLSSSLIPGGGQIVHTRVLDELGQLFASADPLLSSIDTADLSTAVDELAAAYGGEGREIASSLRAGTELTALLARTIPAQLAALDAFTRFSVAIESEGPTFNTLAADGNRTMPLFDAAESAYAHLLSYLGTFSQRFTALVSDYRPDIDTLLDQGDNVIRVLLTQRQNVVQLVQGLANYAYKFAHGSNSATLPDGSRFAFFKTFVVWTDVENFVCSLIAPDASGLGFLKPLQQAVLSGNTMLNCSSQLRAFEAAQTGSGSGYTVKIERVASAGTHGGSSSSAASTGGAGAIGGITSAGQQAADAIYGSLGEPDNSPVGGIAGYVDSLLPAYSGPLP